MNNHMRLTLVGENKSVELNDPSKSTYLQAELTGLTTLPGIRATKGTNIGMDGGWTSAQFYEPRLISVKGVIANQDVAEVEMRRRELLSLLAEKNLKLEFQTEAGHEYAVDVVVASVTMPLSQVLIASNFKIDFRADDPLIYDNTAGGILSTTLTKSTGVDSGFTINFPINFQLGDPQSRPMVDNFGSSKVYPEIELKGPLTNPQIVNITTNESFTINKTLSASDTVIVSTKNHTALLNGADIYKDFSGDWLQLEVGINEFELLTTSASDTGSAEIRYKVGYMGV